MNIEDIKKLRMLAVAADQPHSGVARDYFRQSVTAPRMLTLLDLAELQLTSFQQRVQPWMLACFGETISGDREERNHRFLEEALELVQSTDCTASEAHQLVDYVYGRPVGEPAQEVGGVMVTLAALCLANSLDMQAAAEAELARIWTKVDAIRAKQAAKPKHSPLPVAPQEPSPATRHNKHCGCPNCCGAAPLGADVAHGDVWASFEIWAKAKGLIHESHGIRSESSMSGLALEAWHAALATRQPAPTEHDRANFEDWYSSHAHDIKANPIGSYECALQWAAWIAGTSGCYKAPSDWKIAPQPWGINGAAPVAAAVQGDALSLRDGEDIWCMREQAAAWHAIHAALTEVSPGWHCSEVPTTGIERAVTAIKDLAQCAASQPPRPAYDWCPECHARESAGEPDSERAPAPTAQQERAWFKGWVADRQGPVSVDQVEFGRLAWAERARRAAKGGAQ